MIFQRAYLLWKQLFRFSGKLIIQCKYFNWLREFAKFYMGVTFRKKKLRVGLFVPAFFLFNNHGFKPVAIEKEKELHCNPSRKTNKQNQDLINKKCISNENSI